MAKVCTGCGLKLDNDGNLIVDTNESKWPWVVAAAPDQCADTAGSPVYCGSDGALRVDPPVMYREFQGRLQVNTGGNDPEDAVFGSPDVGQGADAGIPPATASFVIKNPSDCRPMTCYISHGIEHFLFTVQAGTSNGGKARGDVQPQSRIDISGDAGTLVDVSLHQHWGAEAENGQIFRFDSMANYIDVPTVMTLPPGGSMTVKLSASLYVIAKHQDGGANPGKIRISNWSNAFKIRGWVGP